MPLLVYIIVARLQRAYRELTSLAIKQILLVKTPVTEDTFDVDITLTIKVMTSNVRTPQEFCFDKSEGGYYQMVKLIRTMAIPLEIDCGKNRAFFTMSMDNRYTQTKQH